MVWLLRKWSRKDTLNASTKVRTSRSSQFLSRSALQSWDTSTLEMKNWKKVTSADGEIFYINSKKEEVWVEIENGGVRKLPSKHEMFFKFRTDLVKMEDLSTSAAPAQGIEKWTTPTYSTLIGHPLPWKKFSAPMKRKNSKTFWRRILSY